MQLLKMELRGFKSFADKTILTFDEGITAIVGPNGSGKSNISDAVRWVMGEQNVRQLRGLKSEDIIFSGTEKRRPQGAGFPHFKVAQPHPRLSGNAGRGA